MSVGENVRLVEELHRLQGEMYAGGPAAPVADLLADEVVWHVPGSSPIAGEHRGWEAVLRYFELRRRLARETMRMRPGEVLADGEAVVQLVDGEVTLGEEEVRWRTVGVYRVERGQVQEVWLVPLDLYLFDQIWNLLGRAAG